MKGGVLLLTVTAKGLARPAVRSVQGSCHGAFTARSWMSIAVTPDAYCIDLIECVGFHKAANTAFVGNDATPHSGWNCRVTDSVTGCFVPKEQHLPNERFIRHAKCAILTRVSEQDASNQAIAPHSCSKQVQQSPVCHGAQRGPAVWPRVRQFGHCSRR
jgi:hypothetical protein